MIKNNSIFQDLFVLDLANNHFGDLKHAKKIITEFSKVKKKYKIKATIKFQFRNLDTYIHKNEINNKENKYVERFLSTKLSDDSYLKLLNFAKNKGFLTSCTPFDEISVEKIKKYKFDILKIASVSSLDWSLLEKAAKTKLPMIVSTGGRTIEEIDKIVSFLEHKKCNFALMHCISIYPSENYQMQLNTISELKKRYAPITIGWSTHETSENLLPSTIAYSIGARMFEKHIGINTKRYRLNKYSTVAKDFDRYLINLNAVKVSIGNEYKIVSKKETTSLKLLERGVYAKINLKKGDILNKKNIYFAFPSNKNQISSTNFSLKTNQYIVRENIKIDEVIKSKSIEKNYSKDLALVTEYLHMAKAMLKSNKLNLGNKFDLEISHHYGLAKFKKFGCFLFNCINREYAKKIIVLLPNQKHPLHRHIKKEETFQILSGKLYSYLDGKLKILKEGDTILVKPKVWHKFHTDALGCIFEEVSTTHYNDDSYYKDKQIQKSERSQRKSYIKDWSHSHSRRKFYDGLKDKS